MLNILWNVLVSIQAHRRGGAHWTDKPTEMLQGMQPTEMVRHRSRGIPELAVLNAPLFLIWVPHLQLKPRLQSASKGERKPLNSLPILKAKLFFKSAKASAGSSWGNAFFFFLKQYCTTLQETRVSISLSFHRSVSSNSQKKQALFLSLNQKRLGLKQAMWVCPMSHS